jgi:hypothetical protein
LFSHANGDVDVALEDTYGVQYISSTSTTDNETVEATNDSSLTQTYYLEVMNLDNTCVPYEMRVSEIATTPSPVAIDYFDVVGTGTIAGSPTTFTGDETWLGQSYSGLAYPGCEYTFAVSPGYSYSTPCTDGYGNACNFEWDSSMSGSTVAGDCLLYFGGGTFLESHGYFEGYLYGWGYASDYDPNATGFYMAYDISFGIWFPAGVAAYNTFNGDIEYVFSVLL